MAATIFYTDGELPTDSPVYIERRADRDALLALLDMAYVVIQESRQQGTTSLIKRLFGHPALTGYTFAYLDATKLAWTSEADWYWGVYSTLANQIGSLVNPRWYRYATTTAGWQEFLTYVAAQAAEEDRRVVVTLDKIGVLWKTWAASFFSALRGIYNLRGIETELGHLAFILAGPFHSDDLVEDVEISPFNVAVRARLQDFSVDQVRLLVSHLGLSDERTEQLTDSIFNWTSGHPYLTQLVCKRLAELHYVPTVTDVDRVTQLLHRGDEYHILPLLNSLEAAPKLAEYTDRILSGERVRFIPWQNARHGKLELLGVLKADREGYCCIRNRIYAQALTLDDKSFPHALPREPQMVLSVNIPRDLLEQLRKGNSVLFCGAGISVSEDGLPSGAQLAQELAQRASLGDVGGMTLPEVAQAYELEMGHHNLIAYITKRIDDTRYIPLRAHHLVAALPFKRIITTNWDNLLEEALRQARKPFVKVVRDADVAFADEEKILLIKLHGSIEQKDSIVITGDDYYDVFARLPETANLVRSYFATKTLIFLGFGLADEDFKRLYHEVVRHLGKHKRRAYAVQLDPSPLTVKYWLQKNVQVIAADATAFLEALRDELDLTEPSPPPSPEQRPFQPTLHLEEEFAKRCGQFLREYAGDISQRQSEHAKLRLAWLSDHWCVYLIENDIRRWIPDPQTLKSIGRWEDIEELTLEELAAFPRGEPLNSVVQPSKPHMVRLRGQNEVYLIERGCRRWIPDPATLKSIGRQEDVEELLLEEELEAFPLGEPVLSVVVVDKTSLSVTSLS